MRRKSALPGTAEESLPVRQFLFDRKMHPGKNKKIWESY